MTVERREYLNNYCATKACLGFEDGECDNCMYEKGRADAIEECTEAYFDVIEDVLHDKDLGISLNQALTIYARIMNRCNERAEQLKGRTNGK